MKRVFSLIAAFSLFLCLMPVSAQAAESYLMDFSSSITFMDWVCFPFVVPEGRYYAVVSAHGDSFTTDSFNLLYHPSTFLDFDSYGCFIPVTFELGEDSFSGIDIGYSLIDGSYFTLCRLSLTDVEGYTIVGRGYSVELFPVLNDSASSSPILSEVVNGGMVSGALNQIVDLLPVVLITLIGFIGLRKAIDFLRDFLTRA